MIFIASGSCSRRSIPITAIFAMVLWLAPAEVWAQCTIFCDNPGTLEAFEAGNVPGDTGGYCFQVAKYCQKPVLLGVRYLLDDPDCDPHGPLPCAITAESDWHFPGNGSNACFQGLSINAGWLLDDSYCGLSVSGTLDTDLGMARVHYSASCGDPNIDVLEAIVCQGSPCHRQTNLSLDIGSSALCNPLPDGCGEGNAGAGMCCFGPGNASPPDGSPPGFGLPGTNARFVYQAEGVGHTGAPGTTSWITVSGLGRYWIHEFATRIVSSTPSTAWLITPGGTFRRFLDANADGFYEDVVPSDEYRTLETSGGQWTLTDLDGTVTVFNSDGSWQSTTDRLGNAWTAGYASGLLETVTFPDGRQEVFTYVGGRLSTIEQQGLEDDGTQADCSGSSECRTWTFTWDGDDLQRLDYPDGTARELFYGDGAHPGYMTRRDLVGDDGTSRRVEAAWEYTPGGRIFRTWRGATTYADPAAVEKYEFSSYDSESQPTAVEVTDPYGEVATYGIGYDDDSVKPRLESVAGTCPSCGGPDDRYEYDDLAHPLRPTARIDGNGHRTELTYNPNGTVATRTDAAMTADARTVTYSYDATFPGLRTLEQWPSTSGVGFRETTWAYDATTGVLESMIVSGDEPTYDAESDGVPEGAFSLTTTYSDHNAAGQPGEVDPPGHGTADATVFSYIVPGRNGLLADSRTDPLVGGTAFGYDGLNRRTSVVDPNGVETETLYDPLDRVERVTMAAGTVEALATDYRYDTFRELASVVHPRDNVTAYGYDSAGRLTEIRRQAGELLAAGDERVFYTLDGFGQRTREAHQVWDGAVWQTESATEFDYSSRCYLDRVVHDPDDGGTEVTEYAYDCARNLSAVWDAEHPSAVHPPSQVYVYDARDRLVELRAPWVPGTDCRGVAAPADCSLTQYDYDVQDHLSLVIDAESNPTTYSYSDRDLLIDETSPVSGLTVHRYDDHGELVETTDARGITVKRTIDELDRVTVVDYPDDTLDTVYAYDVAPAACPVGSAPLGRLGSITRDGAAIDYCYDRFGRATRDGELTYTYDANGNVATMAYPGGVEASYTYDLADRPVSLSVTTPAGGGPQPVASGGTYKPAGPLTGLTLGNGTTEDREFTPRYFPESITWTGANVRIWTYQTDAIGNPTSIEATATCAGDLAVADQTISTSQTIESCADLILGPDLTLSTTADVTFRAAGTVRASRTASRWPLAAEWASRPAPRTELRTFEYQDGPYFLTLGDGPWGERDWTYDRIGNRLTETRDRSGTPETDTYQYEPGASGNTARLDEILLSPTGNADYDWDDAGNLDTLIRGANHLDFTFDAASRQSAIDRGDGVDVHASAGFHYDGRGFLRRATEPVSSATVEPLYDSSGLLHALVEEDTPGASERRHTFFYLAGRPVAQLTQQDGAETWQYLMTDHLGSPLVAADAVGEVTWSGGFEPFGFDFAEGTTDSALAAEVFLRRPGQWEMELWADAALGTGGIYFNVHRWYEPSTGRYNRTDPMRLLWPNLYAYAGARPLVFVDPLGLRAIIFNGCEAWFTDDDWNIIKTCSASSGVPGSGVNDQSRKYYGPIPEGEYSLHPQEFSGGLRSLFRSPGWGRWRAPLHPSDETDTFGRDGFFLHGDTRNEPGSLGCIDIADCDTWARDWALERPDEPIPVFVDYTNRVCN